MNPLNFDNPTLNAFYKLQDGPVHECLKAMRDDTAKGLRSCVEDVQLRRLQGKAQLLEDLLDIIATANDVIRKRIEAGDRPRMNSVF